MAISEAVTTQLNRMGIQTDRIYGKNRFLTALEVAKTYYPETEAIAIANGLNFPDALSASRMTYDRDMPVLLSNPNTLTTEVQTYLKQSDVNNYTLLGGSSVLEDGVLSFLNN